MNKRFRKLLSCVKDWSSDPSSVNAFIYDDFPPTEDNIYHSLFSESKHDDTVCEILKLLFSAFHRHLDHLVENHLPGGKYDNYTDSLSKETASVPKKTP